MLIQHPTRHATSECGWWCWCRLGHAAPVAALCLLCCMCSTPASLAAIPCSNHAALMHTADLFGLTHAAMQRVLTLPRTVSARSKNTTRLEFWTRVPSLWQNSATLLTCSVISPEDPPNIEEHNTTLIACSNPTHSPHTKYCSHTFPASQQHRLSLAHTCHRVVMQSQRGESQHTDAS